MTKTLLQLCACAALVVLVACSNDDPATTYSYALTTNCRVNIAENNETFVSQGTSYFTIDFANNTITIETPINLTGGDVFTLMVADAPMSVRAGSTYSFTYSAAITGNGHTITGFNGYVDMLTGGTWFTYQVDGEAFSVYTTSQLVYAYATTQLTAVDLATESDDNMAYWFFLNENGDSCTMRISNFTNSLGVSSSQQVEFDGLAVTPNLYGYAITSSKPVKSTDGNYTLSDDVVIVVNQQGQAVSGEFTCNMVGYKFEGKMFDLSTK